MTEQPFEKELDPAPLVTLLVAKTTAGRLKWEPTASADTFIVSLGGGTTLKLYLEEVLDSDEYGNSITVRVPRLSLSDEKGKTVWTIKNSEVKGGLWQLYKLGQRVGNKLDERMASLMDVLQKL